MCRSILCTLFSDGLMAPTAMKSASNPSPGALSQVVFPQPIPMKRDWIRSFKYIFLIGWTYCSFPRDIYLIISQHVTMSLNGRTQEKCRARPQTLEFSRLVLGSCPGEAVPRPLIAGFPALTRLSLLSPWRTYPALSWTRTLVAMQLTHTSNVLLLPVSVGGRTNINTMPNPETLSSPLLAVPGGLQAPGGQGLCRALLYPHCLFQGL